MLLVTWFSPERDFSWVLGVNVVLLLNSLFVPVPWLIQKWVEERTSKIIAAVGDLLFDSLFLLLALNIHSTNISIYSTNVWGRAVFAFILPAAGALKTLDEVTTQASLEASCQGDKRRTTDLYFAPSKKCKSYAAKAANIFSLFLALAGTIFSSYVIDKAFTGFQMCEDQLGSVIWKGVGTDSVGCDPKVVLSPKLEPLCNFSQILSINVSQEKYVTGTTFLTELPLSINRLKYLEELDVTGHNISSISFDILNRKKFANLKTFRVQKNPIEKKLDFSGNKNVTFFPKYITTFFSQVQSLNFSNTKISCFPKDLFKLSKLKIVDFSHTAITYIPSTAIVPNMRTESELKIYPNYTIYLHGTPVSVSLDWSYEFENRKKSEGLSFVVEALMTFLPNLQSLNLAGNDITNATFPLLSTFMHLQHLNVSHNKISHSPWRQIERLEKLKSLDMDSNRLRSVSFHFTGTDHKDPDTITCKILEVFRNLDYFSAKNNFIDRIIYGSGIGSKRWVEHAFFQTCSQGPMKVLDAAATLFKFTLPYVSWAVWNVAYDLQYTMTERMIENQEDPPYDYSSKCKDETDTCLSIGDRLGIRELLLIADPKKLQGLRLSHANCGPMPSAAVGESFKMLAYLTVEFRPSTVDLDNLYSLSSVDTLDLIPYNEQGAEYCSLTVPCEGIAHTFSVTPAISRMSNLRTFSLMNAWMYDGNLPLELFKLPRLVKLRLNGLTVKTQSISDVIEMVGKSKTIENFVIKSVKYGKIADFPPNFYLLKDTPIKRLVIECPKNGLLVQSQSVLFNYTKESFPLIEDLNVCRCMSNSVGGNQSLFRYIEKASTVNRDATKNIGFGGSMSNSSMCTTERDNNKRCWWINRKTAPRFCNGEH